MKKLRGLLLIVPFVICCRSNEAPVQESESADTISVSFKEPHRPQFHFSPPRNWMNDPNGMVYHDGEYHLFYQYHPDGLTWGPMHWGHAISRDLVHWEHMPIALYPDENGMIFSGSAVVDHDNTSGLGSEDNPPLVAVFTYHDPKGAEAGNIDYQTQGIAYSLDKGRTWTPYERNPVIANPGIKDFRDPKVFWHEETRRWIMILAVADHVELWASENLREWSKLSEFGKEYGAHGGVWECPDLFPLYTDGNTRKWVMLVSINPGGPNGGSATQYFTGEFDGRTFMPDGDESATAWLDYGPDNYAGVTWSDAPANRRIFVGWMSNWEYGEAVPTSPWRSAMTLPRDLSLVTTSSGLRVASVLSKEVLAMVNPVLREENVSIFPSYPINVGPDEVSQSIITGVIDAKDFKVEFRNTKGQQLVVGFDATGSEYFIDRGEAGNSGFSDRFVARTVAPRLAAGERITFTIALDVSSVEVFFDNGISLMTSLFFPDEVLSRASITVPESTRLHSIEVQTLPSIWKSDK